MSSGLCSSVSITCCATVIVSQTEQCLPSVKPVSVHVGSTAASITSVWSLTGITSCATIISPHLLHFEPSVRPVEVQVASMPSISTGLCSKQVFEGLSSTS